MAISPDGMIYLTANDEFQVYDIKNDTWSTSDYPDDASSGYAQIAFDNDGTLFFIGTSPAGGLRSWEKPLDSDWSQGLLIDGAFNLNSLLWSINSQLLLDSSGFRHLLYMNDGTLHYLKENVTGWQNEFNTTKPSQTNNGLSFILDSNDKAHLAWIDMANGTAYYTSFNELSSTWESTIVKQHTASWNSHHAKSIRVIVDNSDDPYIFTGLGTASAGNWYLNQVHYHGKYTQSIDVNDVPGDADGDGTCDALDQATLEYENVDMVFEVNTQNDGYFATFTGLKPLSMSISPQLPDGLNFDTSTGDITGIPLQTDLAGTVYTISTTSINDPFELNVSIKIWDESPLLVGLEQLPSMTTNYNIQDANGFKGNQIAFNSDGSMIHASSYFGQTSTGELFSGIPVLPTHDSDDIFVAKRGIDKELSLIHI